jgi:hypothetical protein
MNTERADTGTQRQLAAIAEVAGLGIAVWLRGGWAMDFYLGRVTREHRDVDWFAWAADAGRITGALTARGWELLPEPPHDQQRDFRRDGVDLSFALITRRGADIVVAGGPWAGEPWPAGMLDGPESRTGDSDNGNGNGSDGNSSDSGDHDGNDSDDDSSSSDNGAGDNGSDGGRPALRGVTCAVISPYAQLEIKRMMPVWVPGLPRRPKDAEDIALLEAALSARGTAAASSPGPA